MVRSVLWPLDGKDVVKCKSTFNRSVKKSFNLPWSTHRYLIEPVSEITHLRIIFGRRFLRFIENIRKSRKPLLRTLLKECEDDTRTVTGSNMRFLMIESGCSRMPPSMKGVKYHEIGEDEEWRIELIKMIIEDKGEDEDRDGCLQILCCE